MSSKTPDYYAMLRIERRSRRQALARKDPANYKRGSDGRVTRIVETTAECCRCHGDFTYRMTTKPRKRCPGCAKIVERERRAASEKKRSRREAAPMPSNQLIRYVGYDPTERPLQEMENDQYEEDHRWP